ncbi:MAG: RNA-binding protein [Saprospiraceae bacterium]|nr:RNA-binding protein [Saprospiraceae bacterium]
MEIYVGRIPFKWKEKDLYELFEPYGKLTQAVIIIDKITRQNKGFGFVTIDDNNSGIRAIEALNNKEIDGRNIIVSISNPKEKGSSGNNVRTKGRNEDKTTHHTKPAKKLPPWLRKEY